VGVITSLSGTTGGLEPEVGQIAVAWEKQVNAQGGINGHPVRVMVLDDGANAARALAAVQGAVQDQHVIAIINMSNFDPAYAAYLQAHQVPLISGEDFDPAWTQNPMFFPTATTLNSVIYAIVDSTKLLGAKSFGDMYDPAVPTAAGAVSFYKQTAEGLGMTWAGAFPASTSAPNYTAPCVAAQEAHTEAIELAYAPAPIPTIATNCARQGYHPIFALADGTWITPFAKVPGLSTAGGPVFAFPWFYNGPQTASFRSAIASYAPDIKQDDFIAETWLALAALQKAAVNVGATPTSAEILQGLWSFHDETLGGLAPSPLTFTQGQPAPQNKCWFVIQIKAGAYTTPNGLTASCQP
jgi:branched-chain amino acid transport system substrate-binding protein